MSGTEATAVASYCSARTDEGQEMSGTEATAVASNVLQ